MLLRGGLQGDTWRRLQTPTAATSAVKTSGSSTSSRPFTNFTTGSIVPGHLQAGKQACLEASLDLVTCCFVCTTPACVTPTHNYSWNYFQRITKLLSSASQRTLPEPKTYFPELVMCGTHRTTSTPVETLLLAWSESKPQRISECRQWSPALSESRVEPQKLTSRARLPHRVKIYGI